MRRLRAPAGAGAALAAAVAAALPGPAAAEATPGWVWPVVGTECGVVAVLLGLLLLAVAKVTRLHRAYLRLGAPEDEIRADGSGQQGVKVGAASDQTDSNPDLPVQYGDAPPSSVPSYPMAPGERRLPPASAKPPSSPPPTGWLSWLMSLIPWWLFWPSTEQGQPSPRLVAPEAGGLRQANPSPTPESTPPGGAHPV